MKGSTTTEYLIVFAVILVIAMIASSLLGFFPGWGGAAGEDANRAKWAQKQPFAVTDSKAKPAGLDVVMQNNGAGKANLRKVVVKPIGKDEKYATDQNIVFEAGQRMTIGADVPEGMPDGTRFGLEYCYTSADGLDTCNGDYETPIPCSDCEIPACTLAGEICGSDFECCSSSCPYGSCCIPNGLMCNEPGGIECCSGFCTPRDDGYGNTCCIGGAGSYCDSPLDCCPAADSNYPLSCLQQSCCIPDGGSACGGENSLCCSGRCVGDVCLSLSCGDGTCGADETYATCPLDCQCVPAGMPAQSQPECCWDLTLFNGMCRKISGTCEYPEECMSNRCEGGYCATDCSASGGFCADEGGCCTGARCDLQASTCIPCIGEDGECAGDGDPSCCPMFSCQFGTPYSCQPSQQCRDNGQECEDASECCNGFCNNGYCSSCSTGTCSQSSECCSYPDAACSGAQCYGCYRTPGSCSPGLPPQGTCCEGYVCSWVQHGCYDASTTCLGQGDVCSGIQTGTCCEELSCVNDQCCFAGGVHCSEPSDCCSGACDHGVCTGCQDNGASCSKDDNCCSLTCMNGQCCIETLQTCYSDESCCSGSCSQENQCCENIGTSCTSDSQCCTGACVKGACAEPGPPGAECDTQGDCTPGGYCVNGACCLFQGYACGGSDQCCDGLSCEGGFCGCKQTGEACSHDFTCCNHACFRGECIDELPLGAECDDGSDCQSQNCNGVCCYNQWHYCDNNSDCCSNLCQSHTCR